MEAAAAVKSYKGWRSGEHVHSTAKKLLHSQSLHVSCRFQAPSVYSACLNTCREQRPGNGWLSMETRRRSKLDCHSSLIDTYSSSCSSTIADVAAVATTTTNYNNTHNDSPASTFTRHRDHDEVGVQELTVYEVNERDRDSPVLLLSSKLAKDWYNRLQNVGGLGLGDLIPFTNKGPYKKHEDTVLTVTGGSGIFTGVYGTVEIRNVEYPIVLFYTFKLHGIPQLPQALRWKTVPPAKGVRPSHNASLPGVALPNFTD